MCVLTDDNESLKQLNPYRSIAHFFGILVNQNRFTMNVSVVIKIMIFILLALFTSWPYFEKIKIYSWLKRIWIGSSIILLVVLGVMDIWDSDQQAKADKIQIGNQINTITKLSTNTGKLNDRIGTLTDRIDSMNAHQKVIDKKQDDRDKKESDRDAKMDQLTLLIQENKGNISKSLKDTVKK